MICKYCGKEMRLDDVDYNKLSFAEFLLISNAIIYDDIRNLQRDDFADEITKNGGERGLTRNE